jgi:hypothetical protein
MLPIYRINKVINVMQKKVDRKIREAYIAI